MYVYLIKIDYSNQYKVGITTNFNRRLRQLQIANPNQLVVESLKCVSTQQGARKLEKQIHNHLKRMNAHIRGEWFNIHPADVLKIKGLFFDSVGGN